MKKQRNIRIACGVILSFLAVGCASVSSREIEPATYKEPSATRFAWHDLVALDVESSRQFYRALFGWTFVSSGLKGYDWIVFNDRVIGGMIDATKLARMPQSAVWLIGVTVDDVSGAAAGVEGAGGTILREPQTLPQRGDMALVADPEGAMLQLIADNPHARGVAHPQIGEWLWTELITEDSEAAGLFYGKAMSFGADAVGEGYTLLTYKQKPQAGIVPNPFEDTASSWIPFVRVSDPSDIAEKAVALGGRIVIPPDDDVREGLVSLILDPGGAPLAVQRWEPSGDQKEGP